MPIPLIPALALATAKPQLDAGMHDALQRPTRIRLFFWRHHLCRFPLSLPIAFTRLENRV